MLRSVELAANGGIEEPHDSLLISSAASSDHLCEEHDGSGGSVRFVNSTVRYHMGGGFFSKLWSGRTTMEQILMVVVCLLVFSCSILLIIIGKTQETQVTVINSSHLSNNTKDLCLSQECVQVAAAIISDLDGDVDPCHDFYKVSFLSRSY